MRETSIFYQPRLNRTMFLQSAAVNEEEDEIPDPNEMAEQDDIDMADNLQQPMAGAGILTQMAGGCHKKRKLPRDALLSSLHPMKKRRQQQHGGFFGLIAAAIAAISSAVAAAGGGAAIAGAVLTGAAGAAGAAAVKGIVGSGKKRDKIKHIIKSTRVGVKDLSQHVVKQASKYIQKNPDNVKHLVRTLTPYVRKAFDQKVKEKLGGMHGSGLKLAGGGTLDHRISNMALNKMEGGYSIPELVLNVTKKPKKITSPFR